MLHPGNSGSRWVIVASAFRWICNPASSPTSRMRFKGRGLKYSNSFVSRIRIPVALQMGISPYLSGERSNPRRVA